MRWAWILLLAVAAGAPLVERLAAQVVGQSNPAAQESPARGQTNGQDSSEQRGAAPRGFFEIVFAGGWTGLLIVLLLIGLSIGALAFCVEHLLTVRHDVLIPSGLPDAVSGHLASGAVAAADQACQAQPSVLSVILRAGLSEGEAGWTAVEKAMEDATAEQAARLLRKIEYLSVIGNIAPMVGLLGTVIGMIFAFQEVADSQGAARAAELASGIYQALVTTVGGLLVAIPSLAAYAVFRNRVDQLVAETAYTAAGVMRSLKRLLASRRATEPRRTANAAHPPPPPR